MILVPDDIDAALQADPLAAACRRAGRRPRVGVSACLLGEHVRHDGGHRRSALLAERLARHLDLVPLCPEVAIGLGVPRPAIQRVRLAGDVERVRGVVDPALDVTARLDDYAQRIVCEQRLDGYVFKARSPSCAPGNAPRFDEGDVQVDTGWGRYAARLHAAFPGMPVRDEDSLAADPAGFVLACHRYAGDRDGSRR